MNQTGLIEQAVFRQHAVDCAAQGTGGVFRADGAADPALHEAGSDTVPWFHAGDVRAYGDDFAGAIRQRDQVGGWRPSSGSAIDDHQVAVVQGRSLHPHQRLTALRLRNVGFRHRQGINAGGLGQAIKTHGLGPLYDRGGNAFDHHVQHGWFAAG